MGGVITHITISTELSTMHTYIYMYVWLKVHVHVHTCSEKALLLLHVHMLYMYIYSGNTLRVRIPPEAALPFLLGKRGVALLCLVSMIEHT